MVTTWEKPIVVGRHAHADQYKATDIKIEGAGKLELVFKPENGGAEQRYTVNNFTGAGVAMGMYNTEASIIDFAHCSFKFSLDRGFPLYLSTKNTILKTYDGMFKDVFQRIYEAEYKAAYEAKGIWYEHRLIDDMVAQVFRTYFNLLFLFFHSFKCVYCLANFLAQQ